VQLDAKNPYAHYAVAISHMFAGDFEVGIRAARQALALSPSFALGHLVLGAAYLHADKPREAVEPLEHGLRLSPYDPQNFTWQLFLALAYTFSGEPQKGLEAAQRSLSIRPGWTAPLKVEIMCWASLGQHERARTLAAGPLSEADSFGDPDVMAKLNPAWIEQMEIAVQQAKG
jgi:adenylate cyclase